jgi:hypothetical protein
MDLWCLIYLKFNWMACPEFGRDAIYAMMQW